MKKIIINQLGPIHNCEIYLNKFTVITGSQASGKSTIAKSIYFFSMIREEIFEAMNIFMTDELEKGTFLQLIKEYIINNIVKCFSSDVVKNNINVECFYNGETFIKIETKGINFVIDFSNNIEKYLLNWESYSKVSKTTSLDKWKKELNSLFMEDYTPIYVPAGRSIMTIFASQLPYIYATMQDYQRSKIDYCTGNYIKKILLLKGMFSSFPEELLDEKTLTNKKVNKAIINHVINIMTSILCGKYKYINGEERIIIDDDKPISINYASSGQQEVLWILNIIFYYLLQNEKMLFIIEEPESHLYPNAQKLITELIALASYNNNVVITTHSPYVLGSINTLLYGGELLKLTIKDEIRKILYENNIIQEQLLDIDKTVAYYTSDGTIKNAIDCEEKLIDNGIIDGAAQDINKLFNTWLDIDVKLK